MRKTVLSCLLALGSTLAIAQLNMTLTDQIDYTQNVSSLWGYIDPEDSTEYAAVGTSTGLSVVDLTDPNNVQEIAFVPDVNSSWREVKSWGHYIYAVTEGGGGMLVVNMNDPTNVTSTHWAPNIPGLGTLNKVHSITVDEFGYLYLNGSNLNGGGPLIVDVSADNGLPVYVGKMPAIYCHDSYARNNRLFTSDISVGNFKIYDISDKLNPVLLATQQTPYNFTHNTWLNDVGNVVFTTDEKANAPVAAYDISDLDNIVELDQFRPLSTIGTGTIPHNVHVWNDWVVTAYYTNGTIIVDGSRPDNLIEVGNFDSFVTNPAGFYGVWGVYPYFPSGIVIASDIQNGLLVYDVNYVRACWLEGKVTDIISGAAISNADVHIESTLANVGKTDLLGNYKTGQATPGVFDVVVSATGYHSKTVQATLENGVLTILDIALEPLVINPFPAFTYTAPTSGCPGITVDFFENSGLAASWAWTFEGGTPATSTDQNPSVTFNESGTHSVSLQVVTQGGSTYDLLETDLVVIAPAPAAAFSSDVDSTSVTFTNSSTNYNNLQWDFGDGGTSMAANPQYEYHGPGTYTVTLTVFGDCGVDVSTQDVTIGPFTPVANFTADIQTGCAPQTVNFTDQSTNAPTSWSWSFYDGIPSTSTEQNPTVVFMNPGYHNVQLTVSNAAGSNEIIYNDFVTLDESPVAGFTPNLNGPTVQFTDVLLYNATTYSWDFGDGGSSDEEFPTHTYAAPGTYTVVLTVNNPCGSDSHTEEITIADFMPVAAFNADISIGCAPLTVTYSDLSSGQPTAWAWTFPGGDPATSTEQNPIVTYATAGSYSVMLTVENAFGSAEISQPDLVVVNNSPVPDFSFTINGNEVLFTNYSSNANTYEWLFNDGSGSTSTEISPTYTFPGVGTYEVYLTAANDCGTVSYTGVVTISGTAPTAAFNLNQSQGCSPLEVQFTDSSADAPTSWAWEFPGGNPATSSEQNPTVTYSTPGVYSVTLTVANSAGSNVSTQTDVITVNPPPFAGYFFSVNELEATFNNISTNGTNYLWDFGDGSTSTDQNPTHSYNANGSYTVTLTVSNECGNSTFDQDLVIAVAAPVAGFTANGTQGCVPFEVTFADQSAGMVTGWAWAFPGGTPANSTEQHPTVTYTSAGTYDVSLTVTGPGGSSAILGAGAIVVEDVPVAGFDVNQVNFWDANFTNTSQGATSYVWDFGDGTTSTEENPVHTYFDFGSYNVILTASNDCGTSTFTDIVLLLDAVEEAGHFGYTLNAAPNPFSNELRVNYELKNSFAKASIVASDVLGRVIGEVPAQSPSGLIELGGMFKESGVYFIRMVVDGQAGNAMKVIKF